MPLTYDIDTKTGSLRTRGAGHLGLAEVLAHFDELQALPDRPTRLDVLLDLTECTSVPEADQLRGVARRVGSLGPNVFGTLTVAASSDGLYGMGRMFEVFAGPFFESIEVFRDLPSAEAAFVRKLSERGG
jgi:hypothetical protein